MRCRTHIGFKEMNGDKSDCVPLHSPISEDVAFGYPRDFLQNQFVYLVISPQGNGLSIGINLNPLIKHSVQRFSCETDGIQPPHTSHLDIDRMEVELDQTLQMTGGGGLKRLPRYANLPDDVLQVRQVILSGDGEPTLSDQFPEAVKAVAHVRAVGRFFKIALVTNSTMLDEPRVHEGLKFFTREDEVWAKLDGGTEAYIRKVNGATASLEKILGNILMLGRRRPMVIRSLFPALNGEPPPDLEIQEYVHRLKELKEQGTQISRVQIYSATRPITKSGCGHLPLKTLSRIAQTVREVTGLRAEVF
jgi:hypothetical protein